MRKLFASVITGAVLSMGLVGATAAPVAQAAQVRVPRAKPGQFCAKRDHNDWTRTAQFGKLKCTRYPSGTWHWKRA
jgi:hypothetical protein